MSGKAMDKIQKETIKVIGQSIGIESLDDGIADYVSVHITYVLRQIVQDALKFQNHSARIALGTQDVDRALALRGLPPIYGFNAPYKVAFKQAQGMMDLFFMDNAEIKFEDVMNAGLPSPPVDPTFSIHWLAVEGVQPAIPQNPPMDGVAAEMDQAVSLRKGTLEGGLMGMGEDSSEHHGVKVKPLVKHVLSREQQMYFEHIKLAITRIDEADNRLLKAALQSLSSDAGLHQILPYFSLFISDQVNKNLRNLSLLMNVMKMTRAILSSPHLFVEPYLHQLMPPILTCLVGKTLCQYPHQDHWALRDFAAFLMTEVCRKYGTSYQSLQPRITKTLTKAFMDPKRSLTTQYGALKGLGLLGEHVVRVLLLPNIKSYLELITPYLNSEASIIHRLEAQQCYGALLEPVGNYVRKQFEDLPYFPSDMESPEVLAMQVDSEEPIEKKRKIEHTDTSGVFMSLSMLHELFDIYGESLLAFCPPPASELATYFI